ncbi:tryptophan--tRNA ligase [Patescibacteria group bacterium]
MGKQILLTGMRPTSHLHVGNYFGALKQVAELQSKYQTYLMVADLHALTTLQDTKNVGKDSLAITALYLAGGINPKKVTLFLQSQIPEQVELATLFGMITPISMLQLNPVYKEMLLEHPSATNLGLLSYPVLQAADILAYKASVVPVGKDQAPHIELAREIARRFNHHFGKIFPEPKTIIQKELKILSLQDPTKKMSKSHGENTQISLLDSPGTIRKKIKSAVTDSGKEIKYNPKNKPAVSNLILLMHLASGTSIKNIEKKLASKGYKELKEETAEAIIKLLTPFQKRYKEIARNPKGVQKLLEEGGKKARKTAIETLKEAKQKIGLL